MSKPRATSFRANEAAASGREEAILFYTRGLKAPNERIQAANYIDSLISQYGPVVEGYPSWHPFTSLENENNCGKYDPQIHPYGFEGLDHTIYFRDAFLTAPYGGDDRVIQSARDKKAGFISTEKIQDILLYNHGTTPVLVTCEGVPKEFDGTITKRFALGRMLSEELPHWENAQCGESWQTMRRYILGTPCGSRSSLFVNQETGQALRQVFDLLNQHELFGPVYRDEKI
jgi:hypothetical protein